MNRSLTFRTSLASKAHVLAIKPHLDAITGKDNWIVDLTDPEHRLMVASGGDLRPDAVVEVLREAGVHAEFITDLPCFC